MTYQTMTLGQCAAFDHQTGAKFKITAWGKICKERNKRGISRRARIRLRRDGMVFVHERAMNFVLETNQNPHEWAEVVENSDQRIAVDVGHRNSMGLKERSIMTRFYWADGSITHIPHA